MLAVAYTQIQLQQRDRQKQMKTQKQMRNQNILKMRQSLSKLPIISKNLSMVQQKMNRITSQQRTNDETQSIAGMTCQADQEPPRMQCIDTFKQKYRMGRKIGQGSSGYVHEVLHLKKNKIYACKSMMFDDEHVPLLKQNFTQVRQLNHASVVKYKALYLDLEKHLAYLVMEMVDLQNLLEFIGTLTPPIKEHKIKWIFEQLFQVLEYLHGKGISHRDIKPDNIMLDPEAKTIKIIDFGIARRMIRRRQKTEMLTITGTLFYRAPQMFIGGGYDQKVDVWAAGITLYEIMYGRTPFASEFHSETIYNIQNMEIDCEGAVVSDLLRDLIVRLLRKDPRERFTAREALDHLWFQKKEVVRTHGRYSDVGHIVQTQFSKYHRKMIEYDPMAFKNCKNYLEIRKNNSPSYHRLEVDDI